MSGLPPFASELRTSLVVRLVPTADIDSPIWAYSTTSSASASSPGGIVKPSVLALLRLMINSNVTGNSIGNSPGLAPLQNAAGVDACVSIGR